MWDFHRNFITNEPYLKMAGLLLSFDVSVTLNVAFLIYILFVSTGRFASASTNSTSKSVTCQESPPRCSAKYMTFDSGSKPEFSIVGFSVDSSHTVCSLDLFRVMRNLHDVKLNGITVSCKSTNTRLVISNSYNNISLHTGIVFRIINCSIYWKDISNVGNNIQLEGLDLLDCRDEFTSGESIFFETCVTLEHWGTDPAKGKSRLSIAGMTKLSRINLLNKDVQPISPALLQHLWPAVILFVCKR